MSRYDYFLRNWWVWLYTVLYTNETAAKAQPVVTATVKSAYSLTVHQVKDKAQFLWHLKGIVQVDNKRTGDLEWKKKNIHMATPISL